jgi:hypothetical protein
MAQNVAAVVGEAGWATAEELLRRVSRRTIGNWLAAGMLVRLRPGVFAVPGIGDRWRARVAGGSGMPTFVQQRRVELLATVGWQTMRFSFAGMTQAPVRCQRQIRAAHAARLRMFHGNVVR